MNILGKSTTYYLKENLTSIYSNGLSIHSVMWLLPMAFNAFATDSNDSEQEIEQSQYLIQLGFCVSGDDIQF